MKVLLATSNKNKREEIKALLKGFKEITVLTLADLKVPPPEIVEDGKTFRQNAVKKSVIISKFFDGMVLADDSGLEVEALYGRPGVRSARFARTKATDPENVEKLLTLMKKVPEHKRKARFVCCIALARNGDLIGSYPGEVKGTILYEPRGNKGFGYDPVFVPGGHEKTFAEMDASFKNKISHRALALIKFKKALGKILKPEEVVRQESEPEVKLLKKEPVIRKPSIKKVKPKTAETKKPGPRSIKSKTGGENKIKAQADAKKKKQRPRK